MIDFDRIENVPFIFLRGNGYSEQHLKSYLDFAPSWLPEDYGNLFTNVSEAGIYGMELVPPAPTLTGPNSLYDLNRQFLKEYPSERSSFPIAKMDEESFVIFKHHNDETVCGRYNFQDDAWYHGPYPTFTDWVYSFLGRKG